MQLAERFWATMIVDQSGKRIIRQSHKQFKNKRRHTFEYDSKPNNSSQPRLRDDEKQLGQHEQCARRKTERIIRSSSLSKQTSDDVED